MIAAAQADAVLETRVAVGELTLIATVAGLRRLVTHLRDNAACAFTTLIDITAVDWPERDDRFEVVYHFLSMPQNQRVRVKIAVAEDEVVPSITDLHPTRRTGTSARSSTCTGSCSRATRTCAAS